MNSKAKGKRGYFSSICCAKIERAATGADTPGGSNQNACCKEQSIMADAQPISCALAPQSSRKIWKSIPGYEGLYEASSDGEIRRACDLLPIKPQFSKRHGYAYVGLTRDKDTKACRVHRAVASAFLGPIPEGHQVNHIDGCKTNNAVSNLEYVTPSENMLHAYATGLQNPVRGERNGRSKLSIETVLAIASLAGRHPYGKIAEMCHTTKDNVAKILSGKSWSHVTGLNYALRNKKRGAPAGRHYAD